MFGRVDAYNVALTGSRCIFAKLTSGLLKRAAAEAQEKGKEEGKGFFGRWGDQLAATLRYGDRYLGMPAEQVLQETKDNFAIAFDDIKNIRFKEKQRRSDVGDAIKRIYGEVTFDTQKGKMVYFLDGMPVDDIAAMQAILGDKVQA